MVSPKQVHALRVVDLQGQQSGHGFDTELSSVDVVSEEEVLLFWWFASYIDWFDTDLNEFEYIIELSMKITNDVDGCFKFKEIIFFS